MLLASITDVMPGCLVEQGRYGSRYFLAAEGQPHSSMLVLDHARQGLIMDICCEEGQTKQWKEQAERIVEMAGPRPLHAIVPESYPWSSHIDAEIVARRYKYTYDLEQTVEYQRRIPEPDWISVEGTQEELARLLFESDSMCPTLEAARQNIGDIYDGTYGSLLASSGLAVRDGSPIGGILLNEDFGRILISHIFVDPAMQGQGWAKWLLGAALERAKATGKLRTVYGSVDASNTGSYRFVRAFGLSQFSDMYHVVRLSSKEISA